ncbi:MAG: hypothetical protein EZS28_032469, partial [Streblomastix strix]
MLKLSKTNSTKIQTSCLQIQALNKLLILFVLAVLSLCEARKHGIRSRFSRIKTNAPEHFQDNILYFVLGYINDEGKLIFDYTDKDLDTFSSYDEVPFSDRNPYRPGTSIEDTSFLAIPKEGFEELQTSQPLNDSERRCSPIDYVFKEGFYALLGYTVKTFKGVDIAPNYGIIIGWESTNWVTAVLSDQTGGYILNTKAIDSSATDLMGSVYINFDGSDTSIIPAADCETTPSLPACSGDCVPNTDKTEEQCGCIVGDTRTFCVTCTGKNLPTADCKCPDVKEGDYTKAKCEEDKGVIPPSDCTGKTEE